MCALRLQSRLRSTLLLAGSIARLAPVVGSASLHTMHVGEWGRGQPRRVRSRSAVGIARAQASSGAPPPVSNLAVEPPTSDDMRVLQERQLGHRVSNVVGVGARCRHGFSQAFAFDPVDRPLSSGRKSRLESGLFRLACPLLVKAIDEWEAEGAVKRINEELGEPRNAHLARALNEAHAGHAVARHEIVGARLGAVEREARAAGAEQEKVVQTVLASGIAGQTRSKLDIKCVHAQLADHLCRSSTNSLGADLLRRLEERGVATRGDENCCAQCSLHVPEAEARRTWWCVPSRCRSPFPPSPLPPDERDTPRASPLCWQVRAE